MGLNNKTVSANPGVNAWASGKTKSDDNCANHEFELDQSEFFSSLLDSVKFEKGIALCSKRETFERFGEGFFPSIGFPRFGDPTLRAEQSISVDVGFDQRVARDRARLGGGWFYTHLQRVIDFN